MMEKISLIIVLLLFIYSIVSANNAITRGPEIGEIYFIGPTVTSPANGIYFSNDFGETVTLKDSTTNQQAITADLTPGGLYFVSMNEELFYSDNYGQQGSWQYKNQGLYHWIDSGRNEGEIYNAIVSHSENYGVDFITHQYNGFFGNLHDFCIDNNDEIGYVILNQSIVPDSVYLLITYDNFNNLEVQHVFDFNTLYPEISRGTNNGELYFYTKKPMLFEQELRYSNDYGNSWELKNTFNCPNLPIKGIVGGRQPGELFMMVLYLQNMQLIKHLYIYHSIDFGETFTIYHPLSFGPDPYYANFEASPTSGSAPLTVHFSDLSGGDPNGIIGWQWDFDCDGEFDSYEQHPQYTYQDTGSYSVMMNILTIGGIGEESYSYRKDYIHVTGGSNVDNNEIETMNLELKNYPNPFNPSTIINYELPENSEKVYIEIYNIKGQIVDKIAICNEQNSIEWKAEDLPTGIYFYKLIVNKKIEIVKKCLLLK